MKYPKLSGWAFCTIGVCAAALVFSPALGSRALAFGGLWSAQGEALRASAAQVILIDNPDATLTAIVRLHYEGAPQSFAWLIPVPGTPTLELSSNMVFERLDTATAPEYWLEVGAEGMCLGDVGAVADPGAYRVPGAAPASVETAAEPIRVLDRGSLGAYDYVVLTADPGLPDPAELATDWLEENGYAATARDSDALAPYLRDGLNLLAVKLDSHADAGAIRPLALTYESGRAQIPLRPLSGAASEDMPLRVWVVGPAQAVPGNYKSLVINDALYDWLSCSTYEAGTPPAGGAGRFGGYVGQPTNYAAVVAAAADQAGGRGFVTELGGPASQYRDAIWGPQDDSAFEVLSTQRYDDDIAAIVEAVHQYGSWDGFRDAVAGATTLPDEVTIEAFLHDPDDYREQASVDTARLFELLQADVIAPVRAARALLHNGPYLTRLYTTLSAQEMTIDPVFAYNTELAQVSNVHIARQVLECEPTLRREEARWRVELPQGGVVAGEPGAGWPLSADSLPANLKVVTLGADGSGRVDQDNSEEIGEHLFDAAGRSAGDLPEPQPPQHGVTIGDDQTVLRPNVQSPADESARRRPGGNGCSATRLDPNAGAPLAAGLLLGYAVALRRRPRRKGHCAC